jgi:hypothetical protein
MQQEIVQVLSKTEIVDPCMPDGLDTTLYKAHYFRVCFDLHQVFIRTYHVSFIPTLKLHPLGCLM